MTKISRSYLEKQIDYECPEHGKVAWQYVSHEEINNWEDRYKKVMVKFKCPECMFHRMGCFFLNVTVDYAIE